MKKTITLIIAVLLFNFTTNAQFKKGSKEKIRAYKIAFLTEQLNLTENEAQKFWPIYNSYDKKMMELRKEERFEIKKTIKQKGGIDNFSEQKAKEILTKIENISQKTHTLKSKFFKQITKVISYKKLLQLEISEHKFNRKLLHRLRYGKHKK